MTIRTVELVCTTAMPTLSVIVPACNSGQTIAEALESVASQTVFPGELIVIDDASTDGTVDVVKRWTRLRQGYAGQAVDS